MTEQHHKITNPETPFAHRLRQLIGYVENATDTTVTTSQDDATRDFIVKVGPHRRYRARSMEEAFEQAFADPANDPLEGYLA